MKSQALRAFTLIRTASKVEGYDYSDGYNLDINYVTEDPTPESDDMIVAGNYCTIFLDDLSDCVITGNTIVIQNRYKLVLQ
jgi:hypothetical protein